MKSLLIKCSIIIAVLGASLLMSQQRPQVRNVDFRNFTFPFPASDLLGAPGDMEWLSANEKGRVTLVNGRHDFDPDGPSVILDEVKYGYLTSSRQLDAIVVLSYHTGGTAYWYYAYVFTFKSGVPRLVGWFQTGSRADGGLYRLWVGNGEFTLDLFDPDKRQGDCCSDGFIRTTYAWKTGKFTQVGMPKFGLVEQTSSTPVPDRQ